MSSEICDRSYSVVYGKLEIFCGIWYFTCILNAISLLNEIASKEECETYRHHVKIECGQESRLFKIGQ